MTDMIIRGLNHRNLKNLNFRIPKNKLVVFTGVSGSGKSSIVFDTIGAESTRQMNETYPAFVRNRLPKYERPNATLIKNLTASVIVDQSPLGGNGRSTVGTISDLYAGLRLLFSRLGKPYVGSASYFSFNDPNGMCLTCSGLGTVNTIDISLILDDEKSLNEGCIMDTTFKPGSYYWTQYLKSGLFDGDKKLKDYSQEEYNLLLYGRRCKEGEQIHPKVDGIHNKYSRTYLKRDLSAFSQHTKDKSAQLVTEHICPDCQGKRLNQNVLDCTINGYSIWAMCEMELPELCNALLEIKDSNMQTLIGALVSSLNRLIEIGLPYLHLNRQSASLSGGEAQRLKLVRYMGSSLSNLTYIFDEPSTGMHPRDVYKMNQLLLQLRDKGNTVLVVEHDEDVIKIADEVIDIGPYGGQLGGEIVFQGSYQKLLLSDTLTAKALKVNRPLKKTTRQFEKTLPIDNASLHNLKNISVAIPLDIMTVVTGVAGSGKSTLISNVFKHRYANQIVMVDQGAITATNRSMPATYLGFFDDIRKLLAKENKVDPSYFSFNSKGACPVCKGKGVVVTELVFMDPVITTCEGCQGTRYSQEAISYSYKGQTIVDILKMTVSEALVFFSEGKIHQKIYEMEKVGLSYMTLGQPLSTLSGGERQRIKLAKHLAKKGSIYILDEPTTGLHGSDIEKLLTLFDELVDNGNTVIVIEHNLDIIKQGDWIIDVGPEGGKHGGQIVFEGTPMAMFTHGKTITSDCLREALDN